MDPNYEFPSNEDFETLNNELISNLFTTNKEVIRDTQTELDEAEIEIPKSNEFKSRTWFVTFNMKTRFYNPEEFSEILKKSGQIKYYIYQLEKGNSGTYHYQAFIEYKSPRTLNIINKYWTRHGAFIAAAKNPNAAKNYCSKIDTREEGPWEYGEWHERKSCGKRKLDERRIEVAEKIDDGSIHNINQIPTDLIIAHGKSRFLEAMNLKHVTENSIKNVCIVGPPGVGKSFLVHNLFPGDISYFQKYNAGWWCPGHTNESVLLIDEFSGYMPISTFLRITDKWPKQIEGKGVMFNGNYKFTFVLSNVPIEKWYHDEKGNDTLDFRTRKAIDRRFGVGEFKNERENMGLYINLYDFFWMNLNRNTMREEMKKLVLSFINE